MAQANKPAQAPDEAVYWYVRIDDATRPPGGRIVNAAERLQIFEHARAVFMAMPSGATVREFADAGTVRLTLPFTEVSALDAVDAAFGAAGYMRDPTAPE